MFEDLPPAKKISNGVKETNKQVISQSIGFASSAFVLVAALAWNDAIKELITDYFKAGSGLISRFIYALIVTLVATIITIHLNHLAKKLHKNDSVQEN